MFRSRIPVNPLPTGLVTPPLRTTTTADIQPAPHHNTPAPVASATHVQAPAVRLTPAGLVTVVAGGTGLVLVVGTVLVSLLLAVAVSAASIAVCAVVLRSLLNGGRRQR
ncbi:SpdD-like protein [Streptomyces sp. NBC_00440]|uniref:SpdD-like protein n=1 Tax=Streptomyces sp. NBC_00440 TaxID=2975741 RepID=UPI002E1A2E49